MEGRRGLGLAVALLSWLPAGVASAAAAGSAGGFTPAGPKLVDPTGATSGFGAAVALSSDGSTLLVGAPQENGGAGAAFLFERNGGSWSELAELTDAGGDSGTQFGSSVALSGNGGTALVGGTGVAEVFSGAQGWASPVALAGSDVAADQDTTNGSVPSGAAAYASALYGWSVALSRDGSTALVGAPHDSCSTCGAVWTFARSASGWSQAGSKLTSGEPQPSFRSWAPPLAGFGVSVALSGDGGSAAIGDSVRDRSCGVACTGGGVAYVYDRQGASWTQSARWAGDAYEPLDFEGFAQSISLSSDGNHALVGPLSGKPAAFTRGAHGWTADVGALSAAPLGEAVELSDDGSRALVAAHDVCGSASALSFARLYGIWSPEPAIDEAGGQGIAEDAPTAAALSGDGMTAALGESSDTGGQGGVWLYSAAAPVTTFAPPEVTKVVPQAVSLQTFLPTVRILGTGLIGTRRVEFRDAAAISFCQADQSSILAVPDFSDSPEVGAANVRVFTPAGISSPGATANFYFALPPQTPEQLTAQPGWEDALVHFAAPPFTGIPLTYTVTASPGARTARTGARSGTVTGLRPGRRYRLTVMAVNAIGTSAASEPSAAVVPEAAPRLVHLSLTGIPRGAPQLRFTVQAPRRGERLRALTLTLPSGLALRGLAGIDVSVAHRLRESRGKLVVQLRRGGVRTVTISLAASSLVEGAALRRGSRSRRRMRASLLLKGTRGSSERRALLLRPR